MDVRKIASLTGHHDRVWHISCHPELPLVASASADRTVRIWSSKKWTSIATLEGNHKRSIRATAWKPPQGSNPPILATASFDGTIGIWDHGDREDEGSERGTGDEDGVWECPALLEGHENEAKCVAWSAGGSYLATCSRDKSVWIWEAAEDEMEFDCLAVLQEHTQDVKCVAWHPAEELLASASYDDTIKLWREDQDDWACCATLHGHGGTVWSIDFEKRQLQGPTGTDARLVSASDNAQIKIWVRESSSTAQKRMIPSSIRTDTPEEKWTVQSTLPAVHVGPVYAVAWSKLSNHIASCGADGKIAVYAEGEGGEWAVVAQRENAHGVYEVNSVAWCEQMDGSGRESLVSGGDDACVNVYEITTK